MTQKTAETAEDNARNAVFGFFSNSVIPQSGKSGHGIGDGIVEKKLGGVYHITAEQELKCSGDSTGNHSLTYAPSGGKDEQWHHFQRDRSALRHAEEFETGKGDCEADAESGFNKTTDFSAIHFV